MKKRLLIIFLIAVFSTGLSPMALAEVKKVEVGGGEEEPPSDSTPKKMVNIMADRMEHQDKKITGIGNVKIKHLNMRISADRVEINTETGFGTAQGNVNIIDEANGHKIHCSLMAFNIHRQQATLYTNKGIVSKEYYFHGKKMERKSENHYVIHDGDITSCIGDNPVWKFKCSKVDAYMGDYAILHNPTFLIKDTPFFYLPYGYVPLDMERSSGFLIPQVGNSEEDGFFAKNSYYWAINEQWDATFGLDYLSERGIRPTGELRYFTSDTTKGEIYADFLRDRQTKENYWQIVADHKQMLPQGVEMIMNLEWLEGTDFDKIYSDSVSARTRRETDNFLTLTKNWETRSLIFETRYHRSLENNLGSESGTLPQLSFRNQSQRLGRSPFRFEMDASYSNFANKTGVAVPMEMTHRVDLHPQLSMPINQWPWLSITPRVGVRETVYDHGKNDGVNNYNEALYRTLYNFDVSMYGPSFTKTFLPESGKGTGFKHLIEPRVSYNYIPDPGNIRNKIVQTDGIDSINKTNFVTYALTNRMFKKIFGIDAFSTKEIVRFDVSQSYDFIVADSGPNARPFSDIRFDFDSSPTDKLMFNFDSTFSIYDNWINTFNVEMVIKPREDFGVYLERRYTRNASTDILGSVRWMFLPGWQFDFTTRYDEKNTQFRENDVGLFYQAQCWGIGMDLIKRTNYYGGQQIDDTRFLFQVTLKGIGSYGSRGGSELHKRF